MSATLPTDAEIDAFFAESSGPGKGGRQQCSAGTCLRRAKLERELADPTRDSLVEAAVGWAGAEGVPVGGPSYAALRSAIHAYRQAHS